MTLLAIIVAIPKAILISLGYLLRQKGLLVIIVIGVAIVFVMGYFNKNNSGASYEIAPYQTIAPTITQAPKVVQTDTRVYYVANLKDDGQVVTLTDYYFYDEVTWKNSKIPLPLDRQYYGEIRIYDRQ